MPRLDLARRLSVAEGKAVIGDRVADLRPTDLEPGTVIHDADTGEPVFAYMPLAEPGPLRRALLQVDCGGVRRARNYFSRSRTFGYSPRRPVLYRESCGLTDLAKERPDIERVLESYADQFSLTLKEILPEVAEAGRAVLGQVLPEWRLGSEQLWTSGVINDTAQLPYHRDGFNFPVWSAMPVVRRGTRGGYLSIPEYGLVVPCADGTVVYFEGFRLTHGVTPIRRVKKGQGYRISVVYYALSGMKNCRDAAEETAYGRRRRTEREADMATRVAAGDRTIRGGGFG
jgi:hypothetical protein